MASALHNLSEVKGVIPSGEGKRIVVVVSEWNSEITQRLLDGAVDELQKNDVSIRNIVIETVPGCFELPLAAQTSALKHNPDAMICLGCVIKGETPHFDYVCQATTQGILQVGLSMKIPVIFGVLTVNTLEQALARSGGKYGNKGIEAAHTALKMIKYKPLNSFIL
ncbi:MAG: 6,7-dimethyl-8-ribityllumazine synthase [Prevotellaceae bacterium]|jgi:6,7-dimethyl-8-ribityllumazine synthase|nr:6,7-dimethyl-8-ribityllumazine synthase [Prevotellaceae bacterium]